MVKPVFKALNAFREAADADAAEKIVIDFLASPDAAKVDGAQAGTFFAEVEKAFKTFQAPNHYERVLTSALSPWATKASFALQQAAHYKHIDLTAGIIYAAEDAAILIQNARVLSGVKSTQTQGKDGVYIQTGTDTPDNPCVEINAARDARYLKEAINDMMLEQPDVSDADAEGFMHTLDVAFRRTKATLEEQLEMLNMITDYCSEDDKLYGLTIQKSMEVIDVMEGRSPRAASPTPARGFNFTRE